ncbi:MAG: hypothetical protein ABEJ92_01310 [Halobacteriales archaeon]
MVRWPWSGTADDGDGDPRGGIDVEPSLVCDFQDGTLYVYDDHVFIERAGPSDFDDKAIPRDEIVDVTYESGLAIGFLQIEQAGVEPATGGFLTSPVGENTLHFGRRDRECAMRAREALLFDDPD